MHLLRNALHSAGAYANFARNLQDAAASLQMLPDALFKLLANAWATKRLTSFQSCSILSAANSDYSPGRDFIRNQRASGNGFISIPPAPAG